LSLLRQSILQTHHIPAEPEFIAPAHSTECHSKVITNSNWTNTVVAKFEGSSQPLETNLTHIYPPSILTMYVPKNHLNATLLAPSAFQVNIFQKVSSPKFCMHSLPP
jgi:hypothetical protein